MADGPRYENEEFESSFSTEKGHVNRAFESNNASEHPNGLNNARDSINGHKNDKGLEHIIANNLTDATSHYDKTEHKKVINNELEIDVVCSNPETGDECNAGIENLKQTPEEQSTSTETVLEDHNGDGVDLEDDSWNDEDQNESYEYSGSVGSGSSFKRSLSFGDKPKRRKNLQKEEKSVNTEHSQPENSKGNEQSSSADSGISDNSWRMTLERFTSKRQGSKRKRKSVSKDTRSYYKKQDELIDQFVSIRNECNGSFYKSQDELINQYEEIRMEIDDAMEDTEIQRQLRKKASIYAKITFAANLVLLVIKIIAVVLSGSISLISSLVDSSVDLVSGIVIWVTTRAVKNTNRYSYPQGRTKLEPMAIVILAVIMSVASLQIIKESFTKIFGLIDNSQSPPNMDWATVGIASATVVVKLILYIMCRRVDHPTVQALALDHRNDVLSNSVAIVFGYLGSTEMQAQVDAPGLIYIDPIGAIVISFYIIANWVITGWDQIKLLIGHTATAAFISKITWICVDHHKKIEKVDTVRAFHFGHNFLVEVDIVLPPEMTLREAHDIAEPLQQKIERLPNVERAFVHIDYEATHDPKTEHKVV